MLQENIRKNLASSGGAVGLSGPMSAASPGDGRLGSPAALRQHIRRSVDGNRAGPPGVVPQSGYGSPMTPTGAGMSPGMAAGVGAGMGMGMGMGGSPMQMPMMQMPMTPMAGMAVGAGFGSVGSPRVGTPTMSGERPRTMGS